MIILLLFVSSVFSYTTSDSINLGAKTYISFSIPYDEFYINYYVGGNNGLLDILLFDLDEFNKYASGEPCNFHASYSCTGCESYELSRALFNGYGDQVFVVNNLNWLENNYVRYSLTYDPYIPPSYTTGYPAGTTENNDSGESKDKITIPKYVYTIIIPGSGMLILVFILLLRLSRGENNISHDEEKLIESDCSTRDSVSSNASDLL